MFRIWVIFLLCSCLITTNVLAVDDNRLWLPKKYKYALDSLRSTAMHAESTERCVSVLRGKLHIKKSTAEAYHFIITCRDANRKSYNIPYTYLVEGGVPDAVEDVRVTGDESWGRCLARLKHKSKNMLSVLMPEDLLPNGYFKGEKFQYDIPFEAKDPWGNRLRYMGVCRISGGGAIELSIKVRKK